MCRGCWGYVTDSVAAVTERSTKHAPIAADYAPLEAEGGNAPVAADVGARGG